MNRIHLKPEFATTGFFYLDHVPTGKLYTGVSKNMQQSIQEMAKLLEVNKSPNKKLNRLYQTEPVIKAYCAAFKTLKAAQIAEKEFRQNTPAYLLLN
jgi:predicted GIY-YIG superfamily endonuclease